jgi:hypothetical protein
LQFEQAVLRMASDISWGTIWGVIINFRSLDPCQLQGCGNRT